jgi:murein DD-endopeptidase
MYLPKPYEGDFEITSEFNPERLHPITGDPGTDNKIKPHKGIDIGTPEGTFIHAPFNGKVTAYNQTTKDGKLTGYGHYIVLTGKTEQGTEVLCVFGHLNEVIVENGQNVIAGQMIGKTGNSGTSTGPHLHFEVRLFDKNLKDYVPHNPREFFCFRSDEQIKGTTFHF